MTALVILAVSFFIVWEDPNPPGTVYGYNVYRVEHTGTGSMVRHKLNAEPIPWNPDKPQSEQGDWTIDGTPPGTELRATALGRWPEWPADLESEISDDFYRIPYPPASPVWRVSHSP